jgi:hypothetical protein
MDATTRRVSVSQKDFIEAIMIGASNKFTNEQVAETLKMNIGSFTTRKSQIERELGKSNITLPKLSRKPSSGRTKSKMTSDEVRALLASFNTTAETVTV